MGIKKTKNQIKREEKEAALRACEMALLVAKTKEKASNLGSVSRKGSLVLTRYIGVKPDHSGAIRRFDDYRAKHYNLARQVLGLIDHTYAKYPVPGFLYRAMLSREGLALVFGDQGTAEEIWRECGKRRFVRWFLTTAQGGSLAQEMKGLLTKKEVHWFLQAPLHNSIQKNLFWAKCAAAGIPKVSCQFLTEQIGSKVQQSRMGSRADDIIRFYATEMGKMRGNDLQEITDFVRAKLWDPAFSYKGRTYSSMVKLSNDWHRSIYSTTVTVNRTWPQTLPAWVHRKKDHCVTAVELTSSRALADEGRRQRHCVFSYEEDCMRGWSKIVSLRWIVPSENLLQTAEVLNRITVELNPQDPVGGPNSGSLQPGGGRARDESHSPLGQRPRLPDRELGLRGGEQLAVAVGGC